MQECVVYASLVLLRASLKRIFMRCHQMLDRVIGIFENTYLPRTRVNKGKRKGRGFDTPARWSSYRPLTAPLLADR
jgi:hypothetical protein